MKYNLRFVASGAVPVVLSRREDQNSIEILATRRPSREGDQARIELTYPGRQIVNIRTADMCFGNMHTFGDLFPKYLEARKSVFIDRLNWHISEANGMEFDQYDTPFCRWVVLVEFGEIVGGVRLMPTTATCGIYSYMLRDAYRGLLEDFPTDVLFINPPTRREVWEASRFFINDSIPGARRLLIQSLLFAEMNRVAKENGAKYILGIVPAIWSRWARRLNVTATPIGAPFTISDFRSQSVMFEVDALGFQAANAIAFVQKRIA